LFLEVKMPDDKSRLAILESSMDKLLSEVRDIKLEIVAANGRSDAAAPLLEQRLQKIESAVGLLELSKGVSF